ncbi:hypothetical protein V8E36_009504 [Tilletia maclaganii]
MDHAKKDVMMIPHRTWDLLQNEHHQPQDRHTNGARRMPTTEAAGPAASAGTKRPAKDASSATSSSKAGDADAQQQQSKKPRTDDDKRQSGSTRAPKPVTSVYVSNLPLDATQEELASVFSRYGVLLEDDTGSAASRIKLYRDNATGMFTGDALITYFKPESVELAINVLDESCLRVHLGQREPVMRVARAEFGKDKAGNASGGKGNGAAGKGTSPGGAHSGSASTSGSNGTGKAHSAAGVDKTSASKNSSEQGKGDAAGRRQLTDAEKRKVQKRMAKLQSKVDGWDSSDEEGPGQSVLGSGTTSTGAPGQIPLLSGDLSAPDAGPSNSRIVILTKMFTLAELDEDPALLLDLKEEVREECENLGKVTNVILYDKEPEGIMSVKFADVVSARACVAKMDKRFFAGRTISAFLSHGKPRYRRTGVRGPNELDDEDDVDGEEAKRHDAFGAWLDGGGDDDGTQPTGQAT